MLWWMPKINNWLHGYIQPLRNNSCRENGWDLLQFDHVFCLTFQGTNAQTAATPHQQPCRCIHFCLSKINLACGSTVEPLKKKPCWWICWHSFGLCGTNIPFFSSHFSYENCQKFGFKFTIFGLWHLGAGCAWSDHESVCVYIYIYICMYLYVNLTKFVYVCIHI